MTIQKYELANGGVNFHGKHPGKPPKGPAFPLDWFYAARSTNTAPLLWQSFQPPRTHAVAWDARGYGDSDDYPGPLRYQDFADDLARVIDHFGAQAPRW